MLFGAPKSPTKRSSSKTSLHFLLPASKTQLPSSASCPVPVPRGCSCTEGTAKARSAVTCPAAVRCGNVPARACTPVSAPQFNSFQSTFGPSLLCAAWRRNVARTYHQTGERACAPYHGRRHEPCPNYNSYHLPPVGTRRVQLDAPTANRYALPSRALALLQRTASVTHQFSARISGRLNRSTKPCLLSCRNRLFRTSGLPRNLSECKARAETTRNPHNPHALTYNTHIQHALYNLPPA